jgi:hypothetical protein
MTELAGKLTALKKQLEFYFGDSNMWKSQFMQQEVAKDPEGCIPRSNFHSYHFLDEQMLAWKKSKGSTK